MAIIKTPLDAMSIKLHGTEDKDKLAEIQTIIVENVAVLPVSSFLKHQELSGDPNAGSMQARRFANAKTKKYGTARAAGKGENLQAKPVIVPIDQHKEIIEEIEGRDLKRYGFSGIAQKSLFRHIQALVTETDTAFFAKAVESGTENKDEQTSVVEFIENLALLVETTKNDFVDGVPRSMVSVVIDPKIASKLRVEVDKLPTTDNVLTLGYLGNLHGIELFMSNHLPSGVTGVAMAYGSVAQPIAPKFPTPDGSRIQLSDSYAYESFFEYGSEAVTPDLIFYSKVTPKPAEPAEK